MIPHEISGPIQYFATALRDGLGLSQRDPKRFLSELRVSSLGMLLAQMQADQRGIYLASQPSKLSDIVVPFGSVQCDVQGGLRVRHSRLLSVPFMNAYIKGCQGEPSITEPS